MEVWLAIDTKTDRLIAFGEHSAVQKSANKHMRLSGNMAVLCVMREGMIILDYDKPSAPC